MNKLAVRLSRSIIARARELVEDIKCLYFNDSPEELADGAMQQAKEETYNVLMEFVTRYESENCTTQYQQPSKKAEEFEILFRNPNNPSVIDKFSVPTVFVVNKQKPNFRQLFEVSLEEEQLKEPPQDENAPELSMDVVENITPPLESSSAKCSPSLQSSKSHKLFSPPLSPFQEFLHSHENSLLEKDEEPSATHDVLFSRLLNPSRHNLSEKDLKNTLDTKIKKAEAAKQENLMRVEELARETTSKVITIRKKNEEQEEALKEQLQLKSEQTERRRQEYLLSKIMKPRSPSSDKRCESAIIWKPQFPVGSEYVLHSFAQSLKIIFDGSENCRQIETVCSEWLQCQTRAGNIAAIAALLDNDELELKQKQLSAQLAILISLFVLFYNSDIMRPERCAALTNYQKLIINNDLTFCNVQRSIFAIPGLESEPELLELLYRAFALLKQQVSHFNNYNMYYEICLSTRLNTLVTLEQFLKCIAEKLSYPLLPDEKQIRSCLQAKKSRMEWIDEQQQLDVQYVKDQLCSGISMLDILQLFFSFSDIYQYTSKTWVSGVIEALISQAAQILLSPQGYYQPRSDDQSLILYSELHTVFYKLLTCLSKILKVESITRDYLNAEQLERTSFNTTKLEFCALMHNLFNPNILFHASDMAAFSSATFKRFDPNEIFPAPEKDSCMLPFVTSAGGEATQNTAPIELGLELLLDSFELDEMITHQELEEIFEATLPKLPIETFVYKKTAALIKKLEEHLLLPSDPNEGFIE